jgi:hypothetical protein
MMLSTAREPDLDVVEFGLKFSTYDKCRSRRLWRARARRGSVDICPSGGQAGDRE